MTKVKICGLTSLEDARDCIEAGADMLGFNFYPTSPRYISPRECARIVAVLRRASHSVQMVGVFVNATMQEIRKLMTLCDLDLAQLSGDEPEEYLAALDGRSFKAIRPRHPDRAAGMAERFARKGSPPAFLIDAAVPGAYGGTGQNGDWKIASSLSRRYPVLLAGGLTPENVASALSQVHPWGVDVASGLESIPGRKDAQKVSTFIQTVRDHELGDVSRYE